MKFEERGLYYYFFYQYLGSESVNLKKNIYIVENCKVYIGNSKIKVFYIINCLICFRNKLVWFSTLLKSIDLVSRLDWFSWSKYNHEIKIHILID